MAALWAGSSSRSSRKVLTPCVCHSLMVLNMSATQPITLIIEADKGWDL